MSMIAIEYFKGMSTNTECNLIVCRVDMSYISRRFGLCSLFLLPFGMRSVT